MTDPKAVVTAFLAALGDLDIDRALTYTSSDVRYQNVPLPPARGIDAVAKQLRLLARFGTGFEARTHNIAAAGPIVLTERTDVLRAGAWDAEFWVRGVFEVHNGQITLWRDYFDWTTVFAACARGTGRAAVSGVRTLVGRYRSRSGG
ncbi:limonene-1,2-epoxide hydrolase family protein [Amycolatopsis sp. H20-H5]|uniref:limonene-1,2-epoxide hydrolase family protein n=1 Tax=Amycolatopsis sp. H20-H5 TaxID=3046309 RepID=UPI002DB5A6F3|nr:limonene-1,2-epoxide hydrolase family protein [Amycolatopsis sp. H20-H5]MEC3980171.1 limonene-1,2-epoxide hydrolase family protein [Amycolatopsis sp. H20-H5]